MASVGDLVDRISRELRQAGIERPRSEARLIVEAATGLAAARQLSRRELEVVAEPALALAARRVAREPMAYLLGRREFWGIEFLVGPGALVPRPETETLIEAVLEALPQRSRPLCLVDLGTGTGCLLLTLLTLYPKAVGIGVDRSLQALRWAQANRRRLGLEGRALLIQSSWLDAVKGPLDVVVANPPYIAPGEPRDPETGHEPEAALLAGTDGLEAYRAIAAPARAALRPGGCIVLEIGAAQGSAVTGMLAAAGFTDIACRLDLADRPRAVFARRGFAEAK